MSNGWFTIAELRAARLPSGERKLKALAERFERMSPRWARVRQPKPGDGLCDLEPEFFIGVLSVFDQTRLRNDETIEARILRLGICRPTIKIDFDEYGPHTPDGCPLDLAVSLGIVDLAT